MLKDMTLKTSIQKYDLNQLFVTEKKTIQFYEY